MSKTGDIRSISSNEDAMSAASHVDIRGVVVGQTNLGEPRKEDGDSDCLVSEASIVDNILTVC